MPAIWCARLSKKMFMWSINIIYTQQSSPSLYILASKKIIYSSKKKNENIHKNEVQQIRWSDDVH